MGRVRAAYLFAKEAATIPVPAQDILFIDTNVYKWMALDELAASAFYAHDYKLGYAACMKLLQENLLPQSEIARVRTNMESYKAKLQEMQAMMNSMQPPQPIQPKPVAQAPKSAYIPPRATRFKERKK